MIDYEVETELDTILRVLDQYGVFDSSAIAVQVRSALIERRIYHLRQQLTGLDEIPKPRARQPGDDGIYPRHPYNGTPGVIGGNCRTCGGSIIEPWHHEPARLPWMKETP